MHYCYYHFEYYYSCFYYFFSITSNTMNIIITVIVTITSVSAGGCHGINHCDMAVLDSSEAGSNSSCNSKSALARFS